MPRTSLLLASLLSLCLVAPSVAQDNQQKNKQQQKNKENNQSKKSSQKRNQANRSKKQDQQVVDVSLDEGQAIAIPAGGELLELTVAVPETVRSGQRYRYHARVSNMSDNITLANVNLVQIDGQKIDIEESQLKQQKNSQKGKQKNDQKNQQAQQQKSNTGQQAQQSSQGNHTMWSLGQLKPGQSRELSVTAIASKTGQTDHCFAVKYDEVLCTQVAVVNPDVTISKSGPEQAVVCEVFEYKYTVKNTGTGVAKDFIVRDKLPKGLMTKSGKDTLEFRVPDLKEGQSESYAAEVHTMEAGQYASRATVEQQSGQTSQSSEVTTQVVAPELNVQIEGPRAFKAGEGGNFDVIVKNTSDVQARNVVLNLDPGKNAKITRAGDGDARDGGNSYRYTLGELKAGAEKSVSVSLDGKEQGTSKQEMLQINAVAKALCARDDDQDRTAIAQAKGNMQAKVLRLTSLMLSVVDMNDVIPKGDNVSYRIRVRNQGSFPDKDVKVKLRLPSGLTFEEADGPSKATANGQRVDLATVDKIAPGETLEWHVTTKTKSSGEKIVTGTLDSNALSNTVEAEEVTTIYDASQQKSSDTQANSDDKEVSQNE